MYRKKILAVCAIKSIPAAGVLFSMIFTSIGCGFNNSFETKIPSQINSEVTIKGSTQTVRHEIVVSAEMTSLFETACTAQYAELPEPIRSESIKLCVAQSTQEFIAGILAMINQQGATK